MSVHSIYFLSKVSKSSHYHIMFSVSTVQLGYFLPISCHFKFQTWWRITIKYHPSKLWRSTFMMMTVLLDFHLLFTIAEYFKKKNGSSTKKK